MSNKVKQRRVWPWLVAVTLLIAGGVALARSSGAGPKSFDPALLVKVKRGNLAVEVLETGKVQPCEKVEIKSKVAGQVERVLVDAGDHVKRGQVLLRLDATDYRRDVAKAATDMAAARLALKFAELTLDRKKHGLAERAVSQYDVETAQNDVWSKQVALASTKVAFNAASDRLRYTQILAPIDGTITERGIQPGEVVTPGVQATFEGRALLAVSDVSTLIVKGELNQIDVARVQLGQKVTLTLDALSGKSYEGTLTKIAPASITPKGKDVEVFPVEATLAKPDGLIKPGMTADMRVHIDTLADVLCLPIECVVKDKGKQYVTVVHTSDKGRQTTERVAVKVGARNDRELQVVSGIREGDLVLIKPGSSAANEFNME